MTPTGRPTALALAVLYAIVPLYGTFVAFFPATPGIPLLVPRWGAALVAAAALAALVVLAPGGIRAAGRDWITFALLSGGIATIITAIPGFDPVLGIGLGLFVTGFGLAGLVLARTADAVTVRLCSRAFLWSALAASLVALAMLASHRPAAIYAFNNGRAIGTFLNPNELAAYTLLALGIAVPLALASRGRDRLATLTALVVVVTLGATFSRWGLLCAVCGVAVYALAARARGLFAAALVLALAGIALNAAEGARHHNPRDTEARLVAWRTGLTTFERFPLTGVGPLAFPRTYGEMRPPQAPGARTAVAFDPHSVPVAFAADGGIVSVVIYFVSWTVAAWVIIRRARGAPARSRVPALALGAVMVALFLDAAINTLSLVFPLGIQGAALALAVLRTDAPS